MNNEDQYVVKARHPFAEAFEMFSKNVAAVIVIGIETKWTKKIVDEIATIGKPVEEFHIERSGDIETIM